MTDFIFGAQTLRHFTEAILAGFKELGISSNPGFELYQIHASPQGLPDDLELLKQAKLSKSKKIFLLHRPDELLLVPELESFFEEYSQASLVVLGDLVLELDYWKARKDFITVIPHPFLNLDLPVKRNDKYVIGSFTAWGEMRKLEHFIELARSLPSDRFDFLIGGTLDGRDLDSSDIPSFMKLMKEPFVPHFNVQLYHLNGKKRIGESSGSLHRGVTIPVIFEANGIERVEGLKVIKVEADENLKNPDFQKAAKEIIQLSLDVDKYLRSNFELASKNLPRNFATSVLKVFSPKMEF